jgi:two-component system, OmpR family, manganese sensing sensor histidine kinase
MFLFTISTRIFNQGFLIYRKRLLLKYLIFTVAISSISGISLYFFVIRSLNQQFDQELLTLVEAATPSLSIVKSEGKQNLEREISWVKLFSNQQYGLEWYDNQGKLLAREGHHFIQPPIFNNIQALKSTSKTFVFARLGKIRTATIAVYSRNSGDEKLLLQGYIRASQSTQEIEVVFAQLRLGLELGGATAIFLVGFSNIYLATETLKPLKKGIQRLRRITADVSHQVRTPLTRISLATEMLLNQTSKSQVSQARKLSIINAAVEQIRHLVEEVSFLIRIDTTPNVEKLRFNDVPLSEVLQSLSEQFTPIASSKGINLQTQLGKKIIIKGCQDELNRLLTNLLENAIRYTDAPGSVFLSVEQSQTKVIVTIRDTGIGIPRDHLPFIFQDFWRSETAKVKYPESVGLGLTIAEAIIQQHQGKITVISEVGVGSCFQVHFPLAKLSTLNISIN